MTATICIKNAAWVAAWNEDQKTHRYLRDADVAFAGNTITFVGKGYDRAADEEIDGRDLLVMPGLIDIPTHCMSEPLGKASSRKWGTPSST